MNIKEFVQENYADYINDISTWVNMQYDLHFKACFDQVRAIHNNMKNGSRSITDTELEWILADLPLLLFSISEDLNAVRLDSEVIKLRKKTVKAELEKKAAALVSAGELNKTDIRGWVDTELADHDILLAAYGSLVTRVESEISFSKELIMGCKKIWDARRKTEASNPVSEVVPNQLPNYQAPDRFHEPYIR